MLKRCIVVTGSNRGLGLELIKQLSKHPDPKMVVATCRDTNTANELQKVAASASKSKVLVKCLEMNRTETFGEFVSSLRSDVECCGGVSCLINNAGISPKASRLSRITVEQMNETFLTNVTAPLLLSKEMLPLFQLSRDGSLIVNISSILGSVELNNKGSSAGLAGGNYAYRSSKSALNMVTRCLAWDLERNNVCVMAVHPGWVKTDLGGSKAPLTPETSIEHVVRRIEEFDPELHNGRLVAYDGETLPF